MLDWWSFPFCYVIKMVTIEGENYSVFKMQHLGIRSAMHVAILVSVNAFMHSK